MYEDKTLVCKECGKEYLQHIPMVYLLAFAEQ